MMSRGAKDLFRRAPEDLDRVERDIHRSKTKKRTTRTECGRVAEILRHGEYRRRGMASLFERTASFPFCERFIRSRWRRARIFSRSHDEGTNFQTRPAVVTFERSRYNHPRYLRPVKNSSSISRTVRAMRYANETALSLKHPNRRY